MSLKKISVFLGIILCASSLHLDGKIFDENILQSIVQNSIQLPELERMSFIIEQLNKTYKTPLQPKFYLFNGGSTFGFVGLLYASLTEYLMIYGSPLANGGHSGRYLLTIRDYVYRGKITIATLDAMEGIELYPGNMTIMHWNTAHHYSLDKNTWMLEYGYGFTPSALPFALLGITSTADVVGLAQLLFGYGKEVTKNLLCMNI
jgi:sigma non-opioid intracellular receptor